MRQFFYPPFGVWLHGDLSQIEMRGAGFVTNDQVLINEYREDADRHEWTRLKVDALAGGWGKIARTNPLLDSPDKQRTASKVVNFNVLFTDDPATLEFNLHKNGIFGIYIDILKELYKEIHIKYNMISYYKFILVPKIILKNKEIINYVRRRRRFHAVADLDTPLAQAGLAALCELDRTQSDALPSTDKEWIPTPPIFGTDYTQETIHKLFPKPIRDIFMEAWNFLIQGPFSGDIPKLMISCVARRWHAEGIKAVPFLSLYDSVECACQPEDVERAVKVATPYFLAPPLHLLTDETPVWKVVPLGIEWSVGPNWDTRTHNKVVL